MKKRVALILVALLVILLLSGCAAQTDGTVGDETQPGHFKLIKQNLSYAIVYDTSTGVMYTMSTNTHNYGSFTLLVNADGSPRIWGGGAENANH